MAPRTPTKAAEPTSKKPPDKASESKVCKKPHQVSGVLSDIIQVRVGDRQQLFQVHKNILCASSPFFRKACNGPWKESQDGRIELPEDDPRAFEVYIKWLYFGMIEVSVDANFQNYLEVYNAYKLGDKILDAAFKNSAIDHIIGMAVREILVDIIRKLMDTGDKRYRLQEERPWIADPCQYHEHPEGTPKCSKQPNK
ncbi:hypothetical protein SLS55_004603 [Diplodia seriata]|uniref:BTB domain-containing protein n=1 Tax=Diplodia seriata TaxID=420778 RepID=A0ABR3CKV7_9PEZI